MIKTLIKKIFITSLMAVSLLKVFAQDDNNREGKNLKDRLFFGGNLGLNFSSDQSVFEIAPIIGYRVTDRLSVGAGPSYTYYKFRVYYTSTQYTSEESSIYGGRVFTEFRILPQILLHAEYILNNLDAYTFNTSTQSIKKERVNVSSLLLGGGYVQPIGGRSAFVITILYDVIGDVNSPYSGEPVINAGVQLGF